MSKEKHMLELQLNSIEDSQELNPTLRKCSFSVMDLGVSGNKQITDKEVLDEAIKYLNHIPINADYLPVTSAGAKDDNFTNHKPIINEDRDGNEFVDTATLAIGHFSSNGRYEEIDGETVIIADAVLYQDKYPNQVALLVELFQAGVKINTSCEYYYSRDKAEIIDGIEHITDKIIFVGHTFLGSNPNGQGGIVEGAYDSSQVLSLNQKWNKSLNENISKQKCLNNKKNNEEIKEGADMEMFQKMMNELSHDDIESKLYSKLEEMVTRSEWYDSYISKVYDNTFILTIWDEGYWSAKYYEFSYTKTETEVEVDLESRHEVFNNWSPVVGELATVQNELIVTKEQLGKVENELKVASENLIIESHNQKISNEKITEMTGKMVSMNSKLEALSEVETAFNKAEHEKALNSRTEDFRGKFEKINALEVFESDEVQTMVLNSIEDESIISSLNAMIVKLIPEVVLEDKSLNNKQILDANLINGKVKQVNNLIPKKEEAVVNHLDGYLED